MSRTEKLQKLEELIDHAGNRAYLVGRYVKNDNEQSLHDIALMLEDALALAKNLEYELHVANHHPELLK